MTNLAKLLVAGAAIGGVAAPAAAQYYSNQQSYPYQQTYRQQQGYPYQQTYPQQGYGYQQGYGQQGYQQGTGNVVTDVIDQLLGNRYNVTDRQAVRQCASAAVAQAQSQYGGYGNRYGQGYGNRYDRGYGQGYGNRSGNGYQQSYAGGGMRVTSISEVQRGSYGLRVRGTLGSAYGNAYQNGGYATGNLTFRCNVDYRGAVTNIRIGRY